jgi:hypothetical protein
VETNYAVSKYRLFLVIAARFLLNVLFNLLHCLERTELSNQLGERSQLLIRPDFGDEDGVVLSLT